MRSVLVLSTVVALSFGLAIKRSPQQGDLNSIDHKPTAEEIGSILDALGQNNPDDADAADQAVDAAYANGSFDKRATPEEIGAALDALGANNPEDAEAADQAIDEAENDKRRADEEYEEDADYENSVGFDKRQAGEEDEDADYENSVGFDKRQVDEADEEDADYENSVGFDKRQADDDDEDEDEDDD